MPMDMSRYPDDWVAISRHIRERAGGRCEWCGAVNGQPHWRTGSRVILTVAHLGAPREASAVPWGDPHDKLDVRDCNLVALCNACHLGYDRDDHARNAARTRRARREAAGQLPLGAG
jgi:predicted component of type VI protein secretion system